MICGMVADGEAEKKVDGLCRNLNKRHKHFQNVVDGTYMLA